MGCWHHRYQLYQLGDTSASGFTSDSSFLPVSTQDGSTIWPKYLDLCHLGRRFGLRSGLPALVWPHLCYYRHLGKILLCLCFSNKMEGKRQERHGSWTHKIINITYNSRNRNPAVWNSHLGGMHSSTWAIFCHFPECIPAGSWAGKPRSGTWTWQGMFVSQASIQMLIQMLASQAFFDIRINSFFFTVLFFIYLKGKER